MGRDSKFLAARAEALELIIKGALEPDAWNQFLDHLCEVVGGSSGALAIRSRKPRPELIDPVAATWPGGAVEAYISYPREGDPVVIELASNMYKARNGPSFVTRDLVEDKAYRRTSFFNDFANEYDMPYLAGVAFDVGSTHFGTLMIYREDGARMFTGKERKFLESLIAPLRTGLETRRRFKGASLAHGVLARLDIPVVALDEAAHIDYANPAAEKLLRRGDVVTVHRGRLRTHDLATSTELQAMCIEAVRGGVPKQGRELLVKRPFGEHPLRLLVLPLSYAISDSLWGGDVPVAIFFFDGQSDQEQIIDDVEPILRDSYGCTPAEAKNAVLYADGATASEVATALGILPETARSHIKNARRKTGTKNKTELSRLIQKLRLPLRR